MPNRLQYLYLALVDCVRLIARLSLAHHLLTCGVLLSHHQSSQVRQCFLIQ